MNQLALRIQDLSVYYGTDAGVVKAVDGITFDIGREEIVGLAGESGCGKSTTALAILGLIKPPGHIEGGRILLGDTELTQIPEEQMRKTRLSRVSLIPQGAMNSLNPVTRVRRQIVDAIKDHDEKVSDRELRQRVNDVLESVGLRPEVAGAYAHELSGGMKQRVCIAIATVLRPELIVADEPTSALDVVVQREVMQTIRHLRSELKVSILLVGHDMGLMAQAVDRLVIMYGGRIAESGPVQHMFRNPLHPYTTALISSLPGIARKGVFKGIPGMPPSLLDPPPGCLFRPRCDQAQEVCETRIPVPVEIEAGRWVACHNVAGGEA
jgi:peptide/nickel transport system ATP-binding protein